MSTTNVEINCVDQTLTLGNNPVIASGGINEVKIKFTFDDKWNGFTKKASFYRSTDAIYKVNIDANNECIIPAIVLTEPGLLYISVYGTFEDERRTSSVIVYRIVQGSNADAPDPLEYYKEQWSEEIKDDLADALTTSATASELSPIPAYDEMTLDELVDEVEDTIMLTDEKQKSLDYFQTIIESAEATVNSSRNTSLGCLLRMGDANHLVELPYLKTENFAFNSNGDLLIGNYIKEVGLDLSSCISLGRYHRIGGSPSVLKKLYITGLCASMGNSTLGAVFRGYGALEEFYIDEISSHGKNGYDYRETFHNDISLRIIGGFDKETRSIDDSKGRIDFTGISNVNQMFIGCNSLEEVRFKPCISVNDGLTLSIDLSSCGVISKESICSLINALQYYIPGTVKSVKVAYPTIYNHMITDWFCKVVDELMHVEICEATDEGAITFEQAIGNLNWTVTH